MEEKKGSNKLLIIIAVVLVLALWGSLIFWYWNRSVAQKQKDSLEKEIVKTQQELKDLLEKRKRGIDDRKVSIYELAANGTWTDDETKRKYELRKASLTSVVADMGNFRNSFKDKDWLVIEVFVEDQRVSGEPRPVAFGNNFRIDTSSGRVSPIDPGTILPLKPSESKLFYVYLPVDKDSKKFQLTFGNLKAPQVLSLDFTSEKALKKEGAFLMKSGFTTDYKSEK